MKIRAFWLIGLAIGGLSCGENDNYQVTMSPKGDALQREVMTWHTNGGEGGPKEAPIAPEKLQAISRFYVTKATTEPSATRQGFVGEFKGKLPADLGGAGEYKTFHTAMGSAAMYIERLSGSDDFTEPLDDIEQAANAVTDILIGWMSTQMEDDTGWPQLQEFLDKCFRKDLKNVVIYLWFSKNGLIRSRENKNEVIARVAQYVLERDYLSPDDAPVFMRLIADNSIQDDQRSKQALLMIRRVLARNMGLSAQEEASGRLDFLSDWEKLNASLTDYLGQTEAYGRMLDEWTKEVASQPASRDASQESSTSQPTTQPRRPEPADVLERHIQKLSSYSDLFNFNIFGYSGDVVTVSLKLPQEPFQTNGTWNKETSIAEWNCGYHGSPLPEICYALWGAPDSEFQTKHFGRVVLDGYNLAEYCLWRASLTDEEGSEWDGFIQTLTPTPTSVEQLKTFRFSHEPRYQPTTSDSTDTQPSESAPYSKRGADMIVSELERPPSTQPSQPTTTEADNSPTNRQPDTQEDK